MPDGELISVTINGGIKKFSELGRHDNSNDDKSKYKKVCIGDIAYNSMRMWQGASGYSPYEGIVSPAYTVLSPNNSIFSKCVAYQFKLPEMIHTFQINSQGITSDNWNLKYPALSKIEICVSKSLQEQQKIAEFFTHLDHLITLHQRKLEKLQNFKKSMLEKMFPQNDSKTPQIRFKGFTNDWEQRKFNEIGIVIDPHPSHRAPKEVENGIPFIGIGDVDEMGNINKQSARLVSESIYDEHRRRYDLSIPSLGLGRVASLGKVIRLRSDIEKYTVSPTLSVLQFAQSINIDYTYAYMNSPGFKNQFESKSNGSTRQSVGTETVRILDLSIPNSMDEQQKIGTFFINLDHLITLHQRKLEKLQNIKKSMLEKMFV